MNNRAQTSILDEIIVDNFAGGGGASTGIELATGRVVEIAINHDPDAILMHRTNHPYTQHLQASVWDVDPVEVCRGRPVGLAWFSPDCKHFSKAKGAALVDRNIRGLAWIVLRWAGKVRPRVIILENVEEFQTWGPVRKGKPVKKKAGQTFRKWLGQLEALGYRVEHRELVAADYGAPTTRKRFVLVARCDGRPIVWPERTHAPADSAEVKSGKLLPWRSAAEIIDWSIPCPSIFESKQEIFKKYGVKAVRPLADATERRAIRGVDKFTIKSAEPFIVECNHSGDGHVWDVDKPYKTITAKHTGGVCKPILAPITMPNTCNSVGSPADRPVHTITSAGNQMLVEPRLTAIAGNQMSIGQTGGGDRIRSLNAPVPTAVSKQEGCVVAANLIQYHTEQSEDVRAGGVAKPLPTVDGSNRHALVSAQLTEYYGNGRPLDVRTPMRTATSHDREALTTAVMQPFHAGGYNGKGNLPTEPVNTITAAGGQSLVTAHIAEFKGQDIGQDARRPLRTVTASAGEFAAVYTRVVKYEPGADLGYWPQIRALLNKYCGYTLADDEVLLLNIGGIWYFISDIGLRMLTPRELYAAMGFPVDYIIDRDYTGKPYPKTAQVARCGNAVCPPMAEAVVRANLPEWCEGVQITTMLQFGKLVAV